MLIDSVSGFVTWIPTVAEVGNREAVLAATDASGRTTEQRFAIAVSATGGIRGRVAFDGPNPPPVAIYLDADADGRRDPGERVARSAADGSYAFAGLDPGAYAVAVDLPAGLEITDPPGGNRTAAVTGGEVVAGVDFTVRKVVANRPPIITSTPPAFVPGVPFAYGVFASDPDGDPLAYSLVQSPPGAAIDPVTGLLTWEPSRSSASYLDRAAWQAAAGGPGVTTALYFDGPTENYGIAVNDPGITPPFAERGVRFLPFSNSDVYPIILRGQQGQIPDPARDGLVANHSSPNGREDLLGRAIRFEFTVPAYAVGAATNIGDGGYLEAFDAAGNSLGRVNLDSGVFGGLITADPIASVALVNTYDGDITFGIWDISFGTLAATDFRVRADDGRGGTAEQAFTLEGFNLASSIGGAVWDDRNGDGTRDADELPLPGVALYIDSNVNGRPDANEPTATSAVDGGYRFGGLAPGTYRVGVLGSRQQEVTAPARGGITIPLAVNENIRDIDFGVRFRPNPENRSPRITSAPPDAARVGQTYRFTLGASDPDGETLTFAVGEGPAGFAVDPSTGAVSWTPTAEQTGPASVTITATDPGGAADSLTFSITVLDPSVRPAVTIASPAKNAASGLPVEVTGTIASPGGRVDFYKVFYARADLVDPSEAEWDYANGRLTDSDYVFIGGGRGPITDGRLASFDPTVLSDDDYVLVVAAFDVNGQGRVEPVRVSVTGGPKLGAFSLSFTDLQIPLAGIPIAVTREYDTRNAADGSDFGYGWRLGVADARIRESVPQTGDGFFTTGAAFRAGTRVYLTNPEGRRVGFTFRPEPTPVFFGAGFRPAFVADPGVTDTLSVDDIVLTQRSDGTFGVYLFGFPFNPDTYRLTTKDSLAYTYDQFQGLRTVADRNGTSLAYSRDGITSSTGVSVRFVRDARGRIARVIDPVGNAITYAYSAAGDLVSVTDRNGLVTTNTYRADRPHYLDELRDPLGNRAVKAEYDAAGRLIATTDALGDRSEQAYDPDRFTETMADAMGNVTTLVYDPRGNVVRETNPLGRTTLRAYDADDNEIGTTDPRGHTATRTFDSRRNLLSETDALGGTTSYEYNALNQVTKVTDALGRVTGYLFDALGNPTGTIDALGGVTVRTNDAQGRPLTEMDANGYVTAYEYAAGAAGPTKITHPDGTFRMIAYSRLGLPTLITDERGAELTLAYDDSGRLLSVTAPDGGITTYGYTGDLLTRQTDPLRAVTLYGYDAASRLTSKTDALGGVTRYAYDAAGKLVSTTDPLNHTTTTAYDVAGRLASVTDAVGGVTAYEYDASGNKTDEIDANGNRRNNVYDELNRLVRKDDCPCPDEIYGYDALGNLATRTDKRGNVTRYAYDALNRLIRETDALGGVTRYAYDAHGNATAVTDANGRTTRSEYDGSNRLVRRTDPAGYRVAFAHDGAGNRTATTDQLGHTTRFGYDGLGRLLTTTDALGGVAANAYDLAGNLVSTTDPLGHATRYAFDALKRLVSTTDAAGGVVRSEYDAAGNRTALTDQVGNRTAFGYDALNRQVRQTDPFGQSILTGYDPVGNRTSVTDRNGRLKTYAFDELDRPTDETWWEGGIAVRTIDSDYDSVGNLLSITDPDSRYTFTYDLLAARTWQGGGVSVARLDFVNDSRGQRTSVTRAADLTGAAVVSRSVLGSDALGRETSYAHSGAGGTAISAYGYAYDAASRLVRELRNGVAIDYSYDRIDQLLGVDRAVGPDEAYDFDAAGNREGGSYKTGAGNRLTGDGTFTYGHDPEGNLVRKTVIATGAITEYAYDHRNRLVGVTARNSGGAVVSAVRTTYDALDRRTATTTNGVRTVTVHDGDATWADYDAAGVAIARYLTGDVIDEMLARFRPGEGTAWYLTDKLGTVRELLGPTGAVLNRIDYDSFGRILDQTGPTAGDRFTFTGREFDSATGLYYYRARFYDPIIGRFNSEDSLRADLDSYRYAMNSPTNLIDPQGTDAIGYVLPVSIIAGGLFATLTAHTVYSYYGPYSTTQGHGNSLFGVSIEGTLQRIEIALLLPNVLTATIVGKYVRSIGSSTRSRSIRL